MCKFLKVTRNMIYYKYKEDKVDSVLENLVITEFIKSRKNYGARKLKKVLVKHGYYVLRKTISKIMKKYDLASNYITATKKNKKTLKVNNDETPNNLNREFSGKSTFEVVVSDLTYTVIFSEKSDLRKIKFFHTDRSSELKNEVIENIL